MTLFGSPILIQREKLKNENNRNIPDESIVVVLIERVFDLPILIRSSHKNSLLMGMQRKDPRTKMGTMTPLFAVTNLITASNG